MSDNKFDDLTIEELEKAKQAWDNIRKQARVDNLQAEMYLTCIENNIKERNANGSQA